MDLRGFYSIIARFHYIIAMCYYLIYLRERVTAPYISNYEMRITP